MSQESQRKIASQGNHQEKGIARESQGGIAGKLTL